jgi:hypothetical protein
MHLIMTELSDAVKEKENVAVTTKAVFSMLKNKASNSSLTSENHNILHTGTEKAIARLKNIRGPVLRDIPVTSHEALHSKL